MPKLPQELIVEILSRLPVKPLIRFKCVCKTWQFIISDPEFAKLQLKRAMENNNNVNCYRVLLSTWPPQSVDFEEPCNGDISNAVIELRYPAIVKGPPNDFYVGILGSCNGLVCLLDAYGSMFLWNPTTGKYKELPKPDGARYGMYLHGLGYNFSTDDYVVLFASHFTSNDSKETIFELYTLKTGIWRRIEDTDLAPQFCGRSGLYWNGALYWLEIKESGNNEVFFVVAFDIVEEKFKEVMTLPYDVNSHDLSLGISGNCLCIFVEHTEICFEALMLNVNATEASWTRLFSFPHYGFGGYSNIPLCLAKNEEVVMDSDGWEIYLYNPKDRKFKHFKVQNYMDSKSELYIESLVSPYN
ncbi:hypothetical protein JCGZ_01097 [Jatropha curcas]|uniref:F-box domain-containing protein n=1 Tax=Jatropha curcas TaxID=180498 RepID=A0A067L4B5_JATCU|nr:F-box/kelch-repeat protein At3g06240 [Jatropha curcas]KDP39340.1 hypothetical protein JCGZ_01097 [Jatropha curcas]